MLSKLIGAKEPQRRALATAALSNAEQDLASSPGNPSGLLVKVVALGAMGRIADVSEAASERYGKRSKIALEQLSVLRGQKRLSRKQAAWFHMLYGVWHFEIKRRAGFILSAMAGASIEEGRKHFIVAQGLSSDDASIPFAAAIVMLSFEPREMGAEAQRHLATALELVGDEPSGELERSIRQHCASLLKAVENQNYDGARDASAQLM